MRDRALAAVRRRHPTLTRTTLSAPKPWLRLARLCGQEESVQVLQAQLSAQEGGPSVEELQQLIQDQAATIATLAELAALEIGEEGGEAEQAEVAEAEASQEGAEGGGRQFEPPDDTME